MVDLSCRLAAIFTLQVERLLLAVSLAALTAYLVPIKDVSEGDCRAVVAVTGSGAVGQVDFVQRAAHSNGGLDLEDICDDLQGTVLTLWSWFLFTVATVLWCGRSRVSRSTWWTCYIVFLGSTSITHVSLAVCRIINDGSMWDNLSIYCAIATSISIDTVAIAIAEESLHAGTVLVDGVARCRVRTECPTWQLAGLCGVLFIEAAWVAVGGFKQKVFQFDVFVTRGKSKSQLDAIAFYV